MTGAPSRALGSPVRLRGVTKLFGSVAAVAGVDIDVRPGQFLVLLGPSGSGKSTLVRLLAGVERLDAGEIRISGQVVGDRRRHLPPERRNLAMVFQDYALWPHLDVAGNVGYALRRRRLGRPDHDDRVAGALRTVGLSHLARRYPSELSGGEQQRVALARAVVAEPGLLLFDEPLSNLDADLRERLRVEIATLTRASGATAVYITHDQSEAFALADLIGVMDRGKLVQLAAPEEIYRRPATPFVARFTGAAGEFPGRRVGGPDGDVIDVDIAGSRVRARPIGAVPRDRPVRVLVRPAATSIAHPEVTQLTAGGERCCSVRGVVADVAYRGRGYDHVVVCEGGTLSAVHGARSHARGTRVRVDLQPDGCLAYAVDEEAIRDEAIVTTVSVGDMKPFLVQAARPSP